MDETESRERMIRATELYELVQLAGEHLYEIQDYLDASEFEGLDTAAQAKDLLMEAQESIRRLTEVVQRMHMRPSEDSSSGVLDMD
jgi:hypothetical protein